MYKKIRAQHPSPFQVSCYFQSEEIPYNVPELLAAVLGGRCNLNIYKVGTRVPEIFRVYSAQGVNEFNYIGEVFDFCSSDQV